MEAKTVQKEESVEIEVPSLVELAVGDEGVLEVLGNPEVTELSVYSGNRGVVLANDEESIAVTISMEEGEVVGEEVEYEEVSEMEEVDTVESRTKVTSDREVIRSGD